MKRKPRCFSNKGPSSHGLHAWNGTNTAPQINEDFCYLSVISFLGVKSIELLITGSCFEMCSCVAVLPANIYFLTQVRNPHAGLDNHQIDLSNLRCPVRQFLVSIPVPPAPTGSSGRWKKRCCRHLVPSPRETTGAVGYVMRKGTVK
jgi:hypothetical protein